MLLEATITCEIISVLNILFCLSVKDLIPVPILWDNNSAIQITNNPVFHERTKHIENSIHQIREKISAGVIKTAKIESIEKTFNIFTKSLSVGRPDYLCSKLKMFDVFQSQDWGRVLKECAIFNLDFSFVCNLFLFYCVFVWSFILEGLNLGNF